MLHFLSFNSQEKDFPMLADILEKIDNLPPLPQTITEIEEFRKRADKDADDLLKIIEKDALIISTLLKVSNSAMFGFRTKIETPKRIISLLGINFTIFIAINETVQNMLKTDLAPYQITNEEFMEASSMSSLLANLWLSKVDTELKEDILLPALLQEAGKFILSELLIMKNKSTDFINQQQNDKDIVEIEKEILGTTSSKVTAEIFKHWKLSDKLIDIIEHVDNIHNCKEEYKKHAQILDVIKTACNPTGILSDKNIEKAVKKAKSYNLDTIFLLESIEILNSRLKNNDS
jgi:HD-like signal output (HDOD) protein